MPDPIPSPQRRRLLAATGASFLLPAAGALPAVAEAGEATAATPFALSDVRLTQGPFARAHALNRRYLATLDVDRLLAPCRIEAGLPSPAPKYPNWESMGLDGHTAGHYLTALAQQAAQGDEEMRARLDAMVDALDQVQQANGDGYLGGVPDGRRLWDRIASGAFEAGAFSLDGAWVPFYNLHKMFAGLRDAHLVAGNARARELLVRFADWCDALVARLDDAQLQRILDTEHGGMNEVLADVYALTGERRHLALARRFCHRAILDPLLRREDRLDGLHANTQIPKVIGFARIGELDGRPDWIGAARFFWETVALRRSVAFGGNSAREHFHPADDFGPMLASREGPETCNSYNMLRLGALLHRLAPDPRYPEFQERVLFNHILSTQHPEHGGLVYFTPVRPRHYRVYSQPEQCFWCCVGTGMENHGRHGAFVYARGADALAVNLYIASTLHWRERGLRLRQETAFPDEARSRLLLQLDRPQAFTLQLRHPLWLQGPLVVQVNGRRWPLDSVAGSMASITRTWRDGDEVAIALPMTTRIEGLPDGSDWVAVMHGPLMLAARTGGDALEGMVADDGRGSHIAPGPYLPLDGAPMLVGERARMAGHVQPLSGEPLVFTAPALIRPRAFAGLRLEPFFRVHDARYMAYWRTTTAAGYPAVVAAIEASERERQALEARTLDQVQPGEQQPEVDHAYAGHGSATGVLMGRAWRDTGAWFGYRLRARRDVAATAPLALALELFGGDWNVAMQVEVEGRVLATVEMSGAGTDAFDVRRIALPAGLSALAHGAGIDVRFVAREGRRTPRLFGLRLVEAPGG